MRSETVETELRCGIGRRVYNELFNYTSSMCVNNRSVSNIGIDRRAGAGVDARFI